ncbi:MAG: hypothetical protein IIV79_00240 [Clostridia bacterium]|nr:hypothetical protein [Clostridia bacterium]
MGVAQIVCLKVFNAETASSTSFCVADSFSFTKENISLNPRGDWRMPSDASARTWLEEIDML